MAIREIAQDKIIQGTSSVGVVGAATTEKWYDPYWDPIWNLLPWSELATVIGIGWIGYMAYVTFTDRKKSK
jgi:hypothetical protein